MAALQPVMNGEAIDAVLKCPICQDTLDDPRVFNPCQHMFCMDCIIKYVEANLENNELELKCPFCRTRLNTDGDVFLTNPDRNSWKTYFPKNLIVSQLMEKFKTEDEYCKIHENKLNEHVCVNHSEVFCSDCLRECHKNCPNVQSIKEYTPRYFNQIKDDIEFIREETEKQLNSAHEISNTNDDIIELMEQCRIKLSNAIDLMREGENNVQIKVEEFDISRSSNLDTLEQNLKTSENIYSHLKCQVEISATKNKLNTMYNDICTTEETTKAMTILTEVQSDVGKIQNMSLQSRRKSKELTERNKQKKDVERSQSVNRYMRKKPLAENQIAIQRPKTSYQKPTYFDTIAKVSDRTKRSFVINQSSPRNSTVDMTYPVTRSLESEGFREFRNQGERSSHRWVKQPPIVRSFATSDESVQRLSFQPSGQNQGLQPLLPITRSNNFPTNFRNKPEFKNN